MPRPKKEITLTSVSLDAFSLLQYVFENFEVDKKFVKDLNKLLKEANSLVPKKKETTMEEMAICGEERTITLPILKDYKDMYSSHIQTKVIAYDRVYPYTSDGFIDPKGHFFQCNPLQHANYCYHMFHCTDDYLMKVGWVKVWSFQSMFNKRNEYTSNFRWENKLTKDQLKTMVDWCKGQKVDMKRAFGYKYDDVFNKE